MAIIYQLGFLCVLVNLDDFVLWLVLLKTERLRNRITSSDKSFVLPMIIIFMSALQLPVLLIYYSSD